MELCAKEMGYSVLKYSRYTQKLFCRASKHELRQGQYATEEISGMGHVLIHVSRRDKCFGKRNTVVIGEGCHVDRRSGHVLHYTSMVTPFVGGSDS